MQANTQTQPTLHDLSHLAHFAGHILENEFTEFCHQVTRLSKDLKLPVLKTLNHVPGDQLVQMVREDSREILCFLHDNNARQHIDVTTQRFLDNQILHIENNKVVAEDITLLAYIRKQAFLHFMPSYCTSVGQTIELVKEIDTYILSFATAMATAFSSLLQQRIEERNLFISTINKTLPGAVYIFDLNSYKNIYATDKLTTVIGYTVDELNSLGTAAVTDLIHTDDLEKIRTQIELLKTAADGVIHSYTYRVKLKDSNYRWIRNYETVFKRDGEGKVCQIIAIALNVDKEKKLADDFRKSKEELLEAQKLFKQAQAISHIGHYSLDLNTMEISFTEEASRIYGFDKTIEKFSYKDMLPLRHPDDYENVKTIIKNTITTHEPFDLHFRIITSNGVEKTIHSLGDIVFDTTGSATHLVGTVQDVTERHQLLRKLQESDNLYKQAQALAHLGNWITDLKTGESTWSDEMYSIFEIDKKDPFLIRDWERFIHPGDKEDMLAYLDQCLQKKQPYDKQCRIIVKGGKVKMIHRKGEFMYDADGTAIKLTGTTQDVTEQYNIQKELKENQNFIRKITDAAPSIISSYNVHTGECVFINEGLEKLLGYKAGDVLKNGVRFFTEILHPDDVIKVSEKHRLTLMEANKDRGKNDFISETTYRMRHKNGGYRWFHTYETVFDRNKEDEVEHVLTITLDISAQIAAEEKIREQELFIQHIADASPTILYSFDVTANCFDYINKEIFFVMGYTTGEVIRMGEGVVQRLYHPEDYNQLPERRESIKKFQHRNSMMQYECRVKCKDEEWKWLLVREVVFKTDGEDKPVQILGAALDITKRKDMERTLLQNAFLLEQSNASLEEFAYVASHDLKEPLRKISTFGDRLINTHGDRLTGDGRIYLNKIVDASQRMQTMINDLLSISLISGDRSFQTYSLQAILEDAKQALEYKIENKGAFIKGDGLPDANIIPSQFRHLFQNLLSNSLKFIPPGRQPVVHVTAQTVLPEQVAEYGVAKASRYLKIEISDNGIGFEEEYSGKIFQIFQRLHGKAEYEGTGIGLAICKKIVEHHGGVIYASGKVDAGAVFTIILPA